MDVVYGPMKYQVAAVFIFWWKKGLVENDRKSKWNVVYNKCQFFSECIIMYSSKHIFQTQIQNDCLTHRISQFELSIFEKSNFLIEKVSDEQWKNFRIISIFHQIWISSLLKELSKVRHSYCFFPTPKMEQFELLIFE